MRNKSCPIVTFQTERKGEISLRPVAVEIDVEAALRPRVCLPPYGASNMVNLKLRYCALGSAVRPGTDSGSRERPRHGSKLRHSCNRFQRLWNWALIALELRRSVGYLIGAEGTRKNRLWGAPRA